MFGQLLSPHSVPALVEVLRNSQESDMVRHEAAEALGGIGTPEVLPHLKEWMVRSDSPRVVRESCQVAIDMWEVRELFESTGIYSLITGWLTTVPVTTPRSLAILFRCHKISMKIQINSSTQMGLRRCRPSKLERSLCQVPQLKHSVMLHGSSQIKR